LNDSNPPAHLPLAPISSAYDTNTEMPFNERMMVEIQMSFYAGAKKTTKSLAHSHAHLYQLPTIISRFSTVYGPFGPVRLVLFKFTRAMLVDGIYELIEAVPDLEP